jgi:hypothetical protein
LDSTLIPCSDPKNVASIVPNTPRPWHDQISREIHSFRSIRNPKSKIANPKSLVFFRIQARDLAEDGTEEQVVLLGKKLGDSPRAVGVFSFPRPKGAK